MLFSMPILAPDIRGCEYIAQDTHDEKIYQMLPVYSTNFAGLSAGESLGHFPDPLDDEP